MDRKGESLRIKELTHRAKVSKQTVYLYIKSGILPKPRKLSVNSATYDARHVEYIEIIKRLQERYNFSLSTIGEILKAQKRENNGDLSLLKIQSQCFSPLDRLLPKHVVGKRAFEQTTGLSAKWRRLFEGWGVLTPANRKGKWVYSPDDVCIGKLIEEIRKTETGSAHEFDPEILRRIVAQFRRIIPEIEKELRTPAAVGSSPDKQQDVEREGCEAMSLLLYHLCRKG